VQQSLPLPCRGDFPVSWGEHVSRGLSQWLRSCFFGVGVGPPSGQIGRGKPWALDPCPSLLGLGFGSAHPPNKERGLCPWGGPGSTPLADQLNLLWRNRVISYGTARGVAPGEGLN
jgi:hypothetical protein